MLGAGLRSFTNRIRGDRGKSGICVVSANFGGIDTLKPLPLSPEIDSFYFTDDAGHQVSAAASTWTSVETPTYPRRDFGPRLRGRYFKHQIHRLDAVAPYRWLVWIDANVAIHDTRFITDAVKRLERRRAGDRLLLVPHPVRATIREEYEHIRDEIAAGNEYLRLRYGEEQMAEQMAYFAQKGWNLDAQLWCGTVWIVENSPAIARCWDDWWDQNLRFGMMDQLSLPVILERYGVLPLAADFALDRNPFFDWSPHAKLC